METEIRSMSGHYMEYEIDTDETSFEMLIIINEGNTVNARKLKKADAIILDYLEKTNAAVPNKGNIARLLEDIFEFEVRVFIYNLR